MSKTITENLGNSSIAAQFPSAKLVRKIVAGELAPPMRPDEIALMRPMSYDDELTDGEIRSDKPFYSWAW